MNAVFNHIRNDKILLLGFALAFACCITSFVFLAIFYKQLPPFIPLFNQFPWGDIRLGTPMEFFIPPLLGLVIFLINLSLANFIYLKLPLLSRMLSLTTLLSTFFVLLFTLQTLQLIL